MTKRMVKVAFMGLVAAALVISSAGATTLEHFSASGTVAVKSVPASGGTNLQGNVVAIDGLSFTATKMLSGRGVDMRGAEPKIRSLGLSGTVFIPNAQVRNGKARAVTARGVAIAKNTRKRSSLRANSVTVRNLRLAPGGAKALDLSALDSIDVSATDFATAAGCAAEAMDLLPADIESSYSVEDLAAAGSFDLSNYDAASGLVDFSGLGEIVVSDTAAASAPVSPMTPGLGLLLFGLGGSLFLGLSRHRRQSLVIPATA
jgi:hypothetical protein